MRKIIFIEGPNYLALQLPRGWYIAEVDATGEPDADSLTGPFDSAAAAEADTPEHYLA